MLHCGIYIYSIVGYISVYCNKDFSPLKMTYLTFNWHYSAKSWNFFMQFSVKQFALAALSAYNNYTDRTKTLSFDNLRLTVRSWKIL